MLVDALGDERVGELEQERARAGAEQQRGLAVEAPGLRAGAVQPGVAGAGQRSLGRRPTTHHAAGNTAAAASSFRMSTTRNGTSPSSIASPSESPVTTASHGTPTA